MTAQLDAYKHENSAATHLIGQDWQKLIDMIESRPGESDVKSFDGGGSQYQYRAEDNVLRALQDVKRLRQKDMPLFGRCPETDNFYTVVCSSCSMILMPHALKEHYEKRHGTVSKSPNEKQTVESSPSKAKPKKIQIAKTEKTADKSKRLKLGPESTEDVFKDSKRLDKLKKGKPSEKFADPTSDHSTGNQRMDRGKQKGSQRFAADLQPIVALSPIQVLDAETESNDGRDLPKNKKRDKKKCDRKPDKIYDPDKHCGVINDSGKPCVRSILCKVHQVALKRAVLSRTMPYDMLIRILKSHNDEEKIKAENNGPTLRLTKLETGEKVPTDAKEAQNGDVQSHGRLWTTDQISIKKEEPPTKRLKVKEEVADEDIDQNQFALPSHLEALIDETLKTLKDVDEGESLPIIPIVPKAEPLIRWDFEMEDVSRKSPSPPPHMFLEDIHWHSNHPKPLATNTFGCRLIGGLMSTCKKLDTLRKHLQSVWTSSASSPPSIRTGFGEVYNSGQGCQGTNPSGVNPKNGFPSSKYVKKPNQNKAGKKSAAPVVAKTGVGKRKRRSNSNIVQNATSNASEIISGLLISNQRSASGSGSVPAISTGVIPVNSITGNGGVPLRLFQGSLPVIASTSPSQPATFIQLNLCPPK